MEGMRLRPRQTFYQRPKVVARHLVRASRQEEFIPRTLTERMFKDMEKFHTEQSGGAGGGTTFDDLKNIDKVWERLRNPVATAAIPEVVTTSSAALWMAPEYDVVVSGGTLGVFLAAALQLRGLSTAVLERGKLRGRSQEWNISRSEMESLVKLGILSEDELEEVINAEFNPVRVGFKGGSDIWTRDVLNLGVKPDCMVAIVSERFKAAGGTVIDMTAASAFCVHPDGVSISLGEGALHAAGSCYVVGSLASSSSLFARGHSKPAGVCCVVGSLASGFPTERNATSDLIYSTSDIDTKRSLQYFWEAFPTGAGPSHRTTYLFSYLDANPSRPSLQELLEDYWHLMPEYQGVSLSDLRVERILFGFFPTFRDSPLKPGFDRVLQVGDASGVQSPLSFGGFGALTRHLGRLTDAIQEAVEANALDKDNLGLINAYNPSLSSAWMLQRAMSVRPGERTDAELINRILGGNFKSMSTAGDAFMRPFLQDVIQFGAISRVLAGQMATDPAVIFKILRHVGPVAILDWLWHYFALGLYTALHILSKPFQKSWVYGAQDAKVRYRIRRLLEAWEYGSGCDH